MRGTLDAAFELNKRTPNGHIFVDSIHFYVEIPRGKFIEII